MCRIRSRMALVCLLVLLLGSIGTPTLASPDPAGDVPGGKTLAVMPGDPDEAPSGGAADLAILAPPAVGWATPNVGCSLHGVEEVFTTVFSDPDGWEDLKIVRFLINHSRDAVGGFYATYRQNTNRVHLIDDAGTGWLGPRIPGTAGPPLENSYASLDVENMTVFGSGNELTITWPVTFKAGFGTKGCGFFLYAIDDSDVASGWRRKGWWCVGAVHHHPGPNPNQIAMLRWYDANEAGYTVTVGDRPHGMAFDGDNIWVTNYGDNNVTKLRPSDGQVLGTYPVGSNPHDAAFDGANIWVTNNGGNSVTKLNAIDGSIVNTYPVGSEPRGLAFDGTNIWVANWGDDTVSKLLAVDGSPVGTYAVGTNPDHIAFDGANIWITKRNDNTVSKMRASDATFLGTYGVGTGPEDLCFDGTNIWVGNLWSEDVTKLRASDGAVLGTYAIGGEAEDVVFDGSHIWVINKDWLVLKLDVNSGSVIDSYDVGAAPLDMVFDGANIWVANYDDDNVQKL